MFALRAVQSLVLVQALLHSTAYGQCPPSGFDAVDELDLDKFTGDRWYSIRQLPVNFQPESQFNCVTAEYEIVNPSTISVFNAARSGSTTGRPVSIRFRATIPDLANEPAKANVGPKFLPRFIRGSRTNYWVVGLGTYNELSGLESEPESPDKYEWAIITTALPESNEEGSDKCYSDGGMWFFSRRPDPPDGYDEALTAIATDLGLDTSVLLPVKHDATCDYDNQEAGLLSNLFTFIGAFF